MKMKTKKGRSERKETVLDWLIKFLNQLPNSLTSLCSTARLLRLESFLELLDLAL